MVKTEHPKVKKHLRKQGPKNLAKEGSEASGTEAHTKQAVEEEKENSQLQAKSRGHHRDLAITKAKNKCL